MNTALLLFGLNLGPLYNAIAQVESDRGATSSNVYQLRKIYCDDVARICKLRGYPNPPPYLAIIGSAELSEAAMHFYWAFYGQRFRMEYPNRIINYEWLARVHNGGPDGWHNISTVGYWRRVKRVLEKEGGVK